MDRPLRNPGSPTNISQQAPTEADVYATASLGRALAYQAGKHTRQLLPGLITGDPSGDAAKLVDMMYLGIARSS